MNISSLVTNSNRLVYILGGGIAFLVFLTFIFILSNFGGGNSGGQEVQLKVWGVFDDRQMFDKAITDFEKSHKGITIDYTLVPFVDYEQALLNALAAGSGPDVFMIHHTWLPKHIDKIRPFPEQFPGSEEPLMTIRQFRDMFADVAYVDLVNDNKIYGMPLYIDTLALYYNRDMLASAGIAQPPATWSEFLDAVRKITTYDQSRNITRSAASMGTARNINRSTDILMMLMLQSGVQMTDDDNSSATFSRSVDGQPVGERSLQFYTDFANPQKEVYTWNDTQDYNIDAFATGRTAMMLNYSHQMPVLRAKAPRLNWGIAKAPQATLADARTYANYWPLTVALRSEHPYEAWQFVHHMAAGAGTVPYLNEAARPSARRDLIAQQKLEVDLGVFAEQALTARSWFQINNQAIETIFSDMIDAVNLGRQTVADALREAEAKVSVLMSR
jgi:multiple sugar transport system substrate-binding protein